jgi:hypothetical protein
MFGMACGEQQRAQTECGTTPAMLTTLVSKAFSFRDNE